MAATTSITQHIGFELEAESVHSSQVSERINRDFWHQDHDASVETDVNMVRNIMVMGSTRLSSRLALASNSTTIGTEMVISPPYSLEKGVGPLLKELESVTAMLMELGEKPENKRAGIHIHVCMPTGLRFFKTYLKLGAHLEDVFYTLGTNGYTFRGQLANDSAFCRPITKWGPPCVPTNGGSKQAQVFTLDRLYSARTSEEFWWRMGNINPNNGVNRYHPSRYTWLNLYSLLAHGTLESRVYNTTLNPYLILAQIMFFQSFCEFALGESIAKEQRYEFEQNSIYDGRDKSQIMHTFLEFCSIINFDSKMTETLSETISRAPAVVIPKGYIRTHLRQDRSYDFSGTGTEYLDNSDVKTITVDDIHARRGERQ